MLIFLMTSQQWDVGIKRFTLFYFHRFPIYIVICPLGLTINYNHITIETLLSTQLPVSQLKI